jgi:acetyl-CoA C-acetyltransferase
MLHRVIDAYLLDGARTPIGRFGGALKPMRAVEFTAALVGRLLERAGVPASEVERVIAGRVIQEMTESNPARVVARLVGIPDRAAAFTLNMQCCSGMAAFLQAAQAVQLGEADCVLALGLESLSNAPYICTDMRWGTRRGAGRLVDLLEESSFAGSKLWGEPMTMIDVAEHHVEVDGIGRDEMDEYAALCHRRAVDARTEGRLRNEIIPIDVPGPSGTAERFEHDEQPRPDTSAEKLASLRPVREGGSVTAGNAAPVNDGAAAAIVCSERMLDKLDARPLARLTPHGSAMVGCDPQLMGYSAVDAVDAALKRAALELDQMDLIECNEGFAVQLLADAKIGAWPIERLNLDGGSLALGHPVGMSGMRIVVHLAHALRERNLDRGVGAVPAGSGLGTAVVLEAVR